MQGNPWDDNVAYLPPPHDQEGPDPFRPISPDLWQGRTPPRRDWMVENCFLRGTVGMISGDGGIGKSLLAQQLATCCVLERPWLGRSIVGGRALYLACEDDHDELWRRQADINRHLEVEMTDVAEAGLYLAPRVGQDNALSVLERKEWRMRPTPLFKRMVAWCRRIGIQLVIIDTATQTFNGNQNDERQVADYITELRRLAIALQGIVLLTKHPSMTGRATGTGESGNVAWHNTCRARLYLRQDKDKKLVLETMKNNYSSSSGRTHLEWYQGIYKIREEDPVTPHRNYYDD